LQLLKLSRHLLRRRHKLAVLLLQGLENLLLAFDICGQPSVSPEREPAGAMRAATYSG
jgi:hypothetical protein